MNIKVFLNKLIEKTGYTIRKYDPTTIYDEDGLRCIHNHDFILDNEFGDAYERGIRAAGEDYQWHWRVHIGLWVAFSASKLSGDFVECGVNRGFLSSAIMKYLKWDTLSKTFYLLDTFKGLDERFICNTEREAQVLLRNQEWVKNGVYVSGVESVKSNFTEWRNVRIIEGSVPDTLKHVNAEEIAFLHLDMNCSTPEVLAAEFFWNRLVSGGFVLMDDYGNNFFPEIKKAMDVFAGSKKVKIVSLPTGQGLLIKACG